MEAGNDKWSILQITCYVQSPLIPTLKALRRKLCQTWLKRDSRVAIESSIAIAGGVIQERSIWRFMNNFDQFLLNNHFTGVHNTER